MITVDEALARLLSLRPQLSHEQVPLRQAAGRRLAEPVIARHDQPPFAASAMDGYAVAPSTVQSGQRFQIIGEAAAGHPFDGPVPASGAVRIFTGAPIPEGANRVIIQEDVTRTGDVITLGNRVDEGRHIRPAAGDFAQGASHAPEHPLGSRDIALIAAMGHRDVTVWRKPTVAILMTGDELQLPGAVLAPGQITASNGYGLAAMVEAEGAKARLLPIAADRRESLSTALELGWDADLLLTVGGASVGDHDLVAQALADAGTEMAFHKIAMRPGKPLMAGRRRQTAVVGLPGNPVSSMVCAMIFVLPMIRAMQGRTPTPTPVPRALATAVEGNGPRQHYMRATTQPDGSVQVADRQDSSLLSLLALNDCLVIRPPHDPARQAGETVLTYSMSH